MASKCPQLLLRCLLVSCLATTTVIGQSPGIAPEPASAASHDTTIESSRFVRIQKDSESDLAALQTSIRHFQAPTPTEAVSDRNSPVEVDLVSAIHVGEASYFEALNKRFRDYDAVLYELVAPEGTQIPKGGVATTSPVSYMQAGMTQMLGLKFQLNQIDYTRPNFVHADMTPQEFTNSMRDREESLSKTLFRAIGVSMVQQAKNDGSSIQILKALFSNNSERELKRALAVQFSDLDGSMLVFHDRNGSTLITERDKKALKVLRREIDRGSRRLAIFYGAGHMDDMEQRLTSEFGMKLVSTDWLTAWDLTQPVTPATVDPEEQPLRRGTENR